MMTLYRPLDDDSPLSTMLERLQWTGEAWLQPRTAQPASCTLAWRRARYAAARGALSDRSGRALTTEHTPRGVRVGASGQLPQRIRVPIQSPTLPRPRAGVLSGLGTRGLPRPAALPRLRRKSSAPNRLPYPAAWMRAPTQLGAVSSEPPLESCERGRLRSNRYPRIALTASGAEVLTNGDIRRMASSGSPPPAGHAKIESPDSNFDI